jgi:hypothetical protein
VPILDISQDILKVLKSGGPKIMNSTAMGLVDTIAILIPVYNLNTAVNSTVTALIAKKPDFDKAYVSIVIQDQLDQYKTHAKSVVDAVVAKLPDYIPGMIGTFLASPILSNLDSAVAAYKPAS